MFCYPLKNRKHIGSHWSSLVSSLNFQREDVYRDIKAFAAKGEWNSMELKRYTQFLVKDFERNGLNLILTKREELQRLRTQIDELSVQYIRNLNDDKSFLIFDHSGLLGLPLEFLKTLEKFENDKYKIRLKIHHLSAVLDLCKVGLTRRNVAVAYGKRYEANLPILEKLVQLRHKSAKLVEDKSDVVELAYNYGVTEYDKGNAYAQIAIGTYDVYKTAD
ncbi:hypothetical protein L2E82_08356 [Cichorium intybus]|uniref:Uncharacterized protein n=1 Tax=Cichorium intybus TaxID=13427 RepID=A0ACB9G799_CICIN|nr:hypothetical protein L2E82_08356 [Cichorium intybus]